MKKRGTKPFKIEPQRFQLDRGLNKSDAFDLMRKKAKRDFRGFNYDPKTGKGELI